MSKLPDGWQYIHAGPYAEWLVPDDKRSRSYNSSDLRGDLAPVLGWNFGIREEASGLRYGSGPKTKKQKAMCRHCFVPKQERAGAPDRVMFCYGDAPVLDVLDLGAVDREAEVRWFREAFAPELRTLADYFASDPVLRWGLVHWFDDYG